MSRVIVLWCPDWPVVAAGADAEAPAAVVSSGKVIACNAAARQTGVHRGQKLRDAQRRCAALAVYTADSDASARAFDHVLTVVDELCPRIEVVRPGLVAIPAKGPSRYYGGELQAAEAIRAAVTSAGFTCSVGVADGSFAATLAARVPPAGVVVPVGETPRFLARHPVSVLDHDDLAASLTKLGIRTLGDFAALPASDVLARFGAPGADAHRLARGLPARPPATRRRGEDLAVVFDFDPPSDAEPVVFAAKSLADELHERLGARGLVCERVEVEVATSDGACWSRLWRHDGLLSSAAVAERVRWQLDSWRTHRPPGGSDRRLDGGVSRLRLAPDHLGIDAGRQLALWGAAEISDRVDRAATRIQVMLGYAGVTRPVLAGGRGPGERVAKVSWGDRRTSTGDRPGSLVDGADLPDSIADQADLPWPGQVPDPLPALVYPTPRSVTVRDEDGHPVRVSGRCVVSARPAVLVVDGEELVVDGWTGPWPAREYWWDSGQARRRARFQVTTDDGRALLLVVDRGQWFVEGAYD